MGNKSKKPPAHEWVLNQIERRFRELQIPQQPPDPEKMPDKFDSQPLREANKIEITAWLNGLAGFHIPPTELQGVIDRLSDLPRAQTDEDEDELSKMLRRLITDLRQELNDSETD